MYIESKVKVCRSHQLCAVGFWIFHINRTKYATCFTGIQALGKFGEIVMLNTPNHVNGHTKNNVKSYFVFQFK